MAPDESYSLLVIAFLIVTIIQKSFAFLLVESLLRLTRPGATIFMLGILVFVYTRHLHYTFLALAMLFVFLLRDVWTQWANSDARRLHMDIGRDQARFDHATNIDLQMADGTVQHETPPLFYTRPDDLLIFPPSARVLHEMNG